MKYYLPVVYQAASEPARYCIDLKGQSVLSRIYTYIPHYGTAVQIVDNILEYEEISVYRTPLSRSILPDWLSQLVKSDYNLLLLSRNNFTKTEISSFRVHARFSFNEAVTFLELDQATIDWFTITKTLYNLNA